MQNLFCATVEIYCFLRSCESCIMFYAFLTIYFKNTVFVMLVQCEGCVLLDNIKYIVLLCDFFIYTQFL